MGGSLQFFKGSIYVTLVGLALAAGVGEVSTAERLRSAGPRVRMSEDDVAATREAFVQAAREAHGVHAGLTSKAYARFPCCQPNLCGNC